MENKVILFDADSLLYQAVYKCITFGEIRALYLEGNPRFGVETIILQRAYDRFEKITFDIFNEIEEKYYISDVKYFFTKCKKNFRKEIDPEYKANRKGNKWVSELRNYLLEYLDGSFASDEYEADDLIYFNSQLMDSEDYIICGIDKDLKQIDGLHFDYYQLKVKNDDGTYKLDEFGKEVKVRKGFIYITKEQAEDNALKMLLVGDASDNVKGVKGIGEAKASKLLEGKNSFGKIRVICNAYAKESDDWKERLRKNTKLLVFGNQ